MKPNRTPEQGQELLPLACGGCQSCPFCTTRAVFLWTLTAGKIDQWGEWKGRARARSKTDSGVSGDSGACTACGCGRDHCAAIVPPAIKCCPDCSHDSRERWGRTIEAIDAADPFPDDLSGNAWDAAELVERYPEPVGAALRRRARERGES